MRLYLITQEETGGYDTYDSAVVVAPDARKAKRIHPGGRDDWESKRQQESLERDMHRWDYEYRCWASHPKHVTAEFIGEARGPLKEGTVICASFNAG